MKTLFHTLRAAHAISLDREYNGWETDLFMRGFCDELKVPPAVQEVNIKTALRFPRPGVARVLAERDSLREQRIARECGW